MNRSIRYVQSLIVLVLGMGTMSVLSAGEIPVVKPEEVGMSSARLGKVNSAVQKLVEDKKISGAITVVARKGKIVHFEAYGQRDITAKKPMTKDTLVRIYSMSKPITSVAVMILVEKGKIKLDDPVAKYLPEMKGLKVYGETNDGKRDDKTPEREMTVRDLLRHTSGLTYGIFGNTPVDKMYREVKIIGSLNLRRMIKKLGQIPLQYAPGTRWHYSVSTDVLGHLVERVSGKKLDMFFQENIFTPLDMKDTAFYAPKSKQDRFAACYGPDGQGGLKAASEITSYRFFKPPTFLSGGGGLVSTARDYVRFCQMLLNKGTLDGVQILRPATVEEMTRNQLPANVFSGPGRGFGLGFSVQLKAAPLNKNRVHVGEYGWGGAASTHFWISPKDDLVVVALSQRMPYSSQLQNAIQPLIYESILEDADPPASNN
jgi:CubicO group peptidase (beta-lactamase class C family)